MPEPSQSFAGQLARIYSLTNTHSPLDLADFLGIRQSEVSRAKRRGEIPREWLRILEQHCNVRPEWILTGQEPDKTALSASENCGRAERDDPAGELLQRLPTRLLAEELLRRLSADEADG